MKRTADIRRAFLRGLDRRIDESAMLSPARLLSYAFTSAIIAFAAVAFGTAHLFGALPRASDISRGVEIGASVGVILGGLAFGIFFPACSMVARRRSQQREASDRANEGHDYRKA
jgi:hypothetical protein